MSPSALPLPVPRVICELHVWQALHTYAQIMGPQEVNCFGRVRQENGVFVIYEIVLLPQEVSGVHADTRYPAQGAWANAEIRAGRSIAGLKMQWHSHGYSPAYFSERDEDYINGHTGQYLISIVMNAIGDYCCRFDLFDPVRWGVEVPVSVRVPGLSAQQVDDLRAELVSKVRAVQPRRLHQNRLAPPHADGPVTLTTVVGEHLLSQTQPESEGDNQA